MPPTLVPLAPLLTRTHKQTNIQAFFDAGAHRYLLRIESSSPELYAKLHPPSHSWTARFECLKELQRIGFQVRSDVQAHPQLPHALPVVTKPTRRRAVLCCLSFASRWALA